MATKPYHGNTASLHFLNTFRDGDSSSSLQRGGILAWDLQQAAPLGNGSSKAPQTPPEMEGAKLIPNQLFT